MNHSPAFLVPYEPGQPERDRNWAFCREIIEWTYPDWPIFVGTSDGPDEFSRTQAIADAYRQAPAEIDTFIVTDADVFLDYPFEVSVSKAHQRGWAVPHTLIHRLSKESTEALDYVKLVDWRDLPLSDDNPQDSQPYRGNAAGTLLVLTRDAYETAPPDPRFVGWGSEDVAWAIALAELVGQPWRGNADLVHLWHPPEPRLDRIVGNGANLALLNRYRISRGSRARMVELMREFS